MEYTVNGHNVFLIVISTFLFSTFLMPLVKKIASHVDAIINNSIHRFQIFCGCNDNLEVTVMDIDSKALYDGLLNVACGYNI